MKIKWKAKEKHGPGSKWIIIQDLLIKGEMVTWTITSSGIYEQLGYHFQCEAGNWWIIGIEVRLATKEEISSHLNK